MKWRNLALALAVAFSFSCSREEPSRTPPVAEETETAPREGGMVIRRLESDVVTLNPVLASSLYDRLVDHYLFVPMVNFDADLHVISGLAQKWEISKDGREYTFHLDPKATYSDGTPVRASDVVFTLKKIVDPQSEAAPIASGFEQIDMRRTRVIDDKTVVVAFKEALASQLIRFNDLLVVPERVYGKGDFKSDFASRVIGTGPYRLVRRQAGKEILLERREDYWGRKPYLKNVLFKVIVDSTTAWNALKRGDIDETMIGSDVWLMESNRPELKRKIDFRRFYTLNYNFIAWNGRVPVFSDKRVRRALSMCIDMRSIINDLYHGTARAMNGPFTPDEWSYNPSVPVTPYDPAGAKQILSSVGWLDSDGDGVLDRDGKPFVFDMLIFSGSTTAGPFAQLFQEELKKIGVTMNVVTLDPAVLIQRVLAGNYDAAYMSWDLDPDPDPFPAFHSSQFPSRGQNFVFYSNPEVDRLIEQGRREIDPSKRVEIYHRIHERLAEDQPYTWTVQVSLKWGINRRVKNVKESRGWGLFDWYPGELDWWVSEKR